MCPEEEIHWGLLNTKQPPLAQEVQSCQGMEPSDVFNSSSRSSKAPAAAPSEQDDTDHTDGCTDLPARPLLC